MALAYFGIEKVLSDISSAARALGPTHYALPWGMCLAAAGWGLYATFISKHPDALINEDVVATVTGMTPDQVRDEARGLLRECRDSERITLVEYDANTHESLLARAGAGESGVVIPTLRWNGRLVHNVVITDVKDGYVSFHDPNTPYGVNRWMPEEEFLERWRDARTDNDVLLISKSPLVL